MQRDSFPGNAHEEVQYSAVSKVVGDPRKVNGSDNTASNGPTTDVEMPEQVT